MGGKAFVDSSEFEVFIGLEKKLIREIARLQGLVQDVKNELRLAQLDRETPYLLYDALNDTINGLLENQDRPLAQIEDLLAKFLGEAHRICGTVGTWLQQRLPS